MLPNTLFAGKDYELNLPKGHLSPSQIISFLLCPEKYRREIVEGHKSPTTIHMVEGTILGDVLEATIVEEQCGSKHPTTKSALARYNRVFSKIIKTVDDWCGVEPGDVRQRGRNFVEKFLHAEMHMDIVPATDNNGGPMVQHKLEFDLAGVPILGFIDIVEAKSSKTEPFRIIDIKCAAEARYYDPENDLQLGLYAVGMGLPNVAFQIFEKRSGKIIYKEAKKAFDLQKKRAWLSHVVGNVARMISLGIFPVCTPKSNPFCNAKFCSHWAKCKGEYV